MARFSVRVTERTLARLDELAREQNSSRAALVRQLIEGAIDGVAVPASEGLSEEELLAILTERARHGHVSATKILLDMERNRDPRKASLDALQRMAESRRQ